MRASTKLTITAVAAGALVLTAGCGVKGSDSAQEQSNPLKLMAQNVAETVREVANRTDEITSVSATMTGTVDGEAVNMRGALAYGTPLRAEFSAVVKGEETTIRLIGSAFYIKMSDGQRADMDGKTWLKMDLSMGGKQGLDLAKQFEDLNPRKQVRTLLDSGAVTAVGEEEVGGVRTVHYSGTVPIAKYLDKMDSELRSAAEKELSSKGVTEVKIDLWVDEEYRPRRVRTVMGTTDMTVDYTDYNKPVSVNEPPASEVADFAALLKELGDLKLD